VGLTCTGGNRVRAGRGTRGYLSTSPRSTARGHDGTRCCGREADRSGSGTGR
jgi:hypothetical protein